MISDSLLFDASSVFFIAWTLTIMGACVAAFGRDLLASEVAAKRPQNSTRKPRAASETAGFTL